MSEKKIEPKSLDFRVSILFALIFAFLIPGEWQRYTYQAPNKSKLLVVVGHVDYTRVTSRWGHELFVVDNHGKKTFLHCFLGASDSKFCPL